MNKPKLLVFDVNETLLDLKKVKAAIQKQFDDATAFNLWFTTLLQYSMVESITNHYHSFAEIGKATLQLTAANLNKTISKQKIDDILGLITQLPPHPDVKTSLSRLKSLDYRMIALTNGSKEALKAQMEFSEIGQYFDRLFSVEQVKSYKPQPKTYHYVLNEMNIAAEDALMIAAHPWDLAGAKAVGMRTAYIQRDLQIYYPLLDKADIMVTDMDLLVQELKK